MLKTTSALAALCASLALAAPASADSIAYVKDGNVWLASPDGARQQQVTTTGGYHYVSQADDGTLAALVGGERIRKLSRTGDVLAEFGTYVSDGAPSSGPVNQFGGPFNPEISRDGKLIAYEWINQNYTNGGSGCNSSSVPPCYVLTSRQGVGITHADRFTGFEEFGLLTGWIGPAWMSGNRLLRSNASVSPNVDAVINTIGPGKGDDELKGWFWDDNGAGGVQEVDITRDEKVAAGIAGYSGNRLRIYRVLYDPMTAPEQDVSPWGDNPDVVEPCIEAGDPVGGRFENLSFSPDGRNLAYSVGNGIWVLDVPDLGGGCGALPTTNKLVIPGGRHPHWGPADIPPASAYERKPVVQPTPAPQPPQPMPQPKLVPPAPAPVRPRQVAVTVRAARLRAALRRGLTLTVQAPRAGSVTATGMAGARKVASGRATARKAGPATVRLRFTKAGARSLRRKRAVQLTVRVAFSPRGGGASQAGQAVVRLAR